MFGKCELPVKAGAAHILSEAARHLHVCAWAPVSAWQREGLDMIDGEATRAVALKRAS